MKRRFKAIVGIMLAVIIFISNYIPINTEAVALGKWIKSDGGWWYVNDSNEYAKSEYIDGYWLDENGWYDPAWDGQWYHDDKGWWFQSGSWYPTDQWLKIDFLWYYFKSDGYMAQNEFVDGRWFDESGFDSYINFNIKKFPAIITHSDGNSTNQEYITDIKISYETISDSDSAKVVITIKGKNLKLGKSPCRFDYRIYQKNISDDEYELGYERRILEPNISKEGDSYTVTDELYLQAKEYYFEFENVTYP